MKYYNLMYDKDLINRYNKMYLDENYKRSFVDDMKKKLKISNVINDFQETESEILSFEIQNIIDNYLNNVKTQSVNYNIALQAKPLLIIKYLESLGLVAASYPSYGMIRIVFFPSDNCEHLVNIELCIDYIEFKSYLMNTKPYIENNS